ncbi:MAG: glucose-1-phosphate cytidylyltransferase [Nanoarchaeota archaeon]|nr:glucose-1-phosphate cytidylyltransferase [Nanoarchaeota archaeon]
MKVVILCGGKGTRLKEETEVRPKPLVGIGGKPILWHIMKIYVHYGFKDFVLCLGYRGNMIKDYFLNYGIMNTDLTLKLGSNEIKIHNQHQEKDWTITFAETGEEAQTGARVKKIEKYIDEDLFMLTYGDGVANIDVKELVEFHKSHGRIGTVTGVHPSSRFGELVIKNKQVIKFSEKPQIKEGFINGGFFVFNKKFFDYLKEDDNCYLEKEPLEKLALDKELMVYPHEDFWQCMDTYRELEILNDLWKSPAPPWKVWRN